MRYGLDDNGFKTLRQISAMLGVPEESVRQYEQRGIRKLRHPQRAGYLREYVSVGDDAAAGDPAAAAAAAAAKKSGVNKPVNRITA